MLSKYNTRGFVLCQEKKCKKLKKEGAKSQGCKVSKG
jgi:hypothetical protein